MPSSGSVRLRVALLLVLAIGLALASAAAFWLKGCDGSGGHDISTPTPAQQQSAWRTT